MNLCNCSKAASKVSVKLPAYEPDRRLAFVDRVCALLIESRYGAEAPFESFAAESGSVGEPDEHVPLLNFSYRSIISDRTRLARPAAPLLFGARPATVHSDGGSRAAINLAQLSIALQPRGSPQPAFAL